MEIWKKMWVGVFFWTQCSNKHDNGLPEKPTAHQACRPYKSFIIIKHDNKEIWQTERRRDKERLTPTWAGHKFTLTHSLVDHRRWRLATANDHSIVFLLHCSLSCDISFSWTYSYNHSTLLCRPSTVCWVFLGDVNHVHCHPRLSVPNFLHFPG